MSIIISDLEIIIFWSSHELSSHQKDVTEEEVWDN